ncbi:MAG: OapB/ArvB family protein [Candidatus Njordarchaeia archaeon]
MEIGFELLNSEFIKLNRGPARVEKIIESAKRGNIIIIEGELAPEEYSLLIKLVMTSINNNFHGVELEKVFIKRKLLKKTVYTVIKPRLNGYKMTLKENMYGFNIVAKIS